MFFKGDDAIMRKPWVQHPYWAWEEVMVYKNYSIKDIRQ